VRLLNDPFKYLKILLVRNHEKTHLGEKEPVEKVSCDECGKHIVKNNLKYHMKSKHTAEKVRTIKNKTKWENKGLSIK